MARNTGHTAMSGQNSVSRAVFLLKNAFGIAVPASFANSIEAYQSLLSTWNDYSSLMSPAELECSFPQHVSDSLSLVPYVAAEIAAGKTYVDIGSGSGLPAIPIALFLPSAELMLVERNERKAAFLRKLLASLNLKQAEVVNASYPLRKPLPQPFVLTARAIEKPHKFVESLLPEMGPNSAFLRQTGFKLGPLPRELVSEEIQDQFGTAGLRKGRLFKITKPKP